MKPILCDSGKEPWKLTPGIPYTWLHGPFPLPVVLSMTYAIINQSHDSDYMLSPVSPLNELRRLRVVILGDPRYTSPILDFQASPRHQSHCY